MRLSTAEYHAILARRQPDQAARPTTIGPDTESALHDAIMAECKRRGFYVVHSRMDRPSTATVGSPDFIIFTDGGRVVVVEAKRRDGKLRPEQAAAKHWLEKLGHPFHVVRSIEEFHGIIR